MRVFGLLHALLGIRLGRWAGGWGGGGTRGTLSLAAGKGLNCPGNQMLSQKMVLLLSSVPMPVRMTVDPFWEKLWRYETSNFKPSAKQRH